MLVVLESWLTLCDHLHDSFVAEGLSLSYHSLISMNFTNKFLSSKSAFLSTAPHLFSESE